MVTINKISPLPYPEESALERAPVRWDIGKGKNQIRMCTPLFSFKALEVYKKAVWAIKLTILGNEPISLSELLTIGYQSEEEEENVKRIIKASILDFQAKFDKKVIPKALCDILIQVSHPLAWTEAQSVLVKYCSDNELDWNVAGLKPISNLKHQRKLKEMLCTYCSFELDIDECCLTLSYLERINSEVKKKVLVDEKVGEKSVFRKAYADSVKARSKKKRKKR